MKSIEKIKKIEREYNRIEKIIRKPKYNPINIFSSDKNITKNEIKKKYYKISLLLHPDKSFDNDRFTRLFTIVTEKYKILMNKPEKKIKEKIIKQKIDIIKNKKNNNEYTISKDLRLVVYKPQEIVKYYNNTQNENYKIISTISMTGAEHRKNKCNSKKDKHQKGLRQRVIQRNNAERRIINHQFSFTRKIAIEHKK